MRGPTPCSEPNEQRGSGHANEHGRQGGCWGQRAGPSAAREARGKASTTQSDDRRSGRWGVAPASQHREILVALASLIRAQRYDMALTILDNELGGGC
jgi:hypothetical protein